MAFHKKKMMEINKTIAELWAATHRGRDIDLSKSNRIRIECASLVHLPRRHAHRYAAHARSTSTDSGNCCLLSVCVCVCVSVGDQRLDRGRCSAGQKALASLIRLALAETFCVNCGILALDEPTTNLDSDNIEAFAHALCQYAHTRATHTCRHTYDYATLPFCMRLTLCAALCRIIEQRRAQSNFQLVVITHDFEFVRLLGRGEFTDHYWAVSKTYVGLCFSRRILLVSWLRACFRARCFVVGCSFVDTIAACTVAAQA